MLKLFDIFYVWFINWKAIVNFSYHNTSISNKIFTVWNKMKNSLYQTFNRWCEPLNTSFHLFVISNQKCIVRYDVLNTSLEMFTLWYQIVAIWYQTVIFLFQTMYSWFDLSCISYQLFTSSFQDFIIWRLNMTIRQGRQTHPLKVPIKKSFCFLFVQKKIPLWKLKVHRRNRKSHRRVTGIRPN